MSRGRLFCPEPATDNRRILLTNGKGGTDREIGDDFREIAAKNSGSSRGAGRTDSMLRSRCDPSW